MKIVTRRIYGPHPSGGKGRRVLLAHVGQEVSDDEYRRILDAEQGNPAEPSPTTGDGRSRFVSGIRVDDVTDEAPVDDDEAPVDDDADDETDDHDEVAAELRHVGGGWYELPNGERIRGRADAEAALAELRDA